MEVGKNPRTAKGCGLSVHTTPILVWEYGYKSTQTGFNLVIAYIGDTGAGSVRSPGGYTRSPGGVHVMGGHLDLLLGGSSNLLEEGEEVDRGV